jgi:hypothetical protein
LARYDRLWLSQKDLQLEAACDRCTGRLAGIERARADWTELRRTGLTAAALMMPDHEA